MSTLRNGFLVLVTCSALLLGCESERGCVDDEICASIVEKYQLESRTIRTLSSERFVLDGVAYDFVESTYGPGSDCEEGCVYNYVCTIVPVDGSGDDFPLDYFWHTDTARIEEFAQYCPDDRFQAHPVFCEMPGFDLPIVCDASVREWADGAARSPCAHGVIGICAVRDRL